MSVKWGKGVFSEELLGLKFETVQKEIIGKTVPCDDGVSRRCVDITPAFGFPLKYIINENDPESKLGHFASVLTVAAIVLDRPLPSPGQIKSHERMLKTKLKIQDDGKLSESAPQSKFYSVRDAN